MSRYWDDTLEHGTKKGGQHKNHKYIARVKEGDHYRYFYSQAEITAYKKHINHLANKARAGKLGNGQTRKLKLAGEYGAVQASVNRKILGKKKAKAVNKKYNLTGKIEMLSKSKSSRNGRKAVNRWTTAKGDRRVEHRGATQRVNRVSRRGDNNVGSREAAPRDRSQSEIRWSNAKKPRKKTNRRKTNTQPKKTTQSRTTGRRARQQSTRRSQRKSLERRIVSNARRNWKLANPRRTNRSSSHVSRGDRNVRATTNANSTTAARARLRNRAQIIRNNWSTRR